MTSMLVVASISIDPKVAESQDTIDDARREQQRLQQQAVDAAAEIDLLRTTDRELVGAVEVVGREIVALDAELQAARNRQFAAERRRVMAEDERQELLNEIGELRLNAREQAIEAYLTQGSSPTIGSVRIGSDLNSGLAAVVLIDAAQDDVFDVVDRIRFVEDSVASAAAEALEAKREATAIGTQVDAQLVTLTARQDAYQELEDEVNTRIFELENEAEQWRSASDDLGDFIREEQNRLEAERIEAARLEAERIELARLEAERLEAERVEAARLEASRIELARLEAERVEAERLAAAQPPPTTTTPSSVIVPSLPTPTRIPTATATPVATTTATATPRPSASPEATPTLAATPRPSSTPAATSTGTASATTPTPDATTTPAAPATATPPAPAEPTPTLAATPAAAATPAIAASPTPTVVAPAPTPTLAPVPTPTLAPVPTPTAAAPAASPAPATSSTGMIWPVPGALVSNFGNRVHPIFGTVRMHNGLDLNGSTGDPIYAAQSGSVLSAGWQRGYGNTIVLDHGSNLSTVYAHQTSFNVAAGDTVATGDVIGFIGSTGNSTGPHLHFEVRVSGSARDPLGYLPPR